MTKVAAFWDTSSLVPLCVQEDTTPQARQWLRRFEPVVWWGTIVEVRSAIARLRRDGFLNSSEKDGASSRLELLRQDWNEILPEVELRNLACSLVDTYPLHAADSLQLAAALTWCRERPNGRTFISFDGRLNDAAKAAGFSLPEFPNSRR